MKHTIGEMIFAFALSAVAAVFAGVVGFMGGVFYCDIRFSGEMTQWALVVAPASALVMAVLAFVVVFWKIATYGEAHPSPPDE